MTILPGARLGPYEIVSPIGAGGMGEVFRARDTKLSRDVAIKVLPSAFADDPERLARFSREAQTLASLNHPNIGAIYGIEDVPPIGGSGSGSRALVMELVEGEDLSAQIARGPIPLADALPIARQIAEALEAAHDQGIVHRDLKPANIKVRADGAVKVLDFGLAKATDGGGAANSQMPNSPTLTRHMTEAGMIMGTAAYMSPEQAKGKAVDKRADITTLTKLTFEGVNRNPAWAPDGRRVTYQSTRDGKSGIYRVPADGSGPPQLLLAAEAGESFRQTSSAPDGTLLYVKLAGGGKPQIWGLPGPAAARPSGGSGRPEHVEGRTPTRLLETTSAVWDAQVSPDGRWVAYVSDESGGPEVYVMPFALDAAPGTPGPGGKMQISTRGGASPRWSRNGRELFYRAMESKLTTVDMTTTPPGRPQPLFAMTHFLYDVTPDPQRVLVSRRGDAGKAGTRSFVVITDWFEDLRRRVPVTR